MKTDNKFNRGKLIAVEGIDGSGKTSLIQHLANYLESRNLLVKQVNRYMISELTELWYRLISANVVDQQSAAMLAVSDYFVGLERCVRPALAEKKVVLADRYFYSHVVHYTLRGVSLGQLQKMFQAALIPDLVFYITISPETAFERLQSKMKPDFWECGLDYRLDACIGQAYLNYQRERPPDNIMRQHFIEHQSSAVKLFPQLLPDQITGYLDGNLTQSELAKKCILEIDKLLR